VKREREVRVVGKVAPLTVHTFTGPRQGGRLELLEGVVFRNAQFMEVNMGASRPAHFLAYESLFERCDFSRAGFASGALSVGERTTYRGCDFRSANLRRIFAGSARFEECDFGGANLNDWGPESAEFIDCRFEGVLRDTRFSGRPTPPDDAQMTAKANEFHGNDFSACELRGVDFRRGIDLERQRLPAGDDYVFIRDRAEGIARARQAISEWREEAAREKALMILNVFSEEPYKDQKQLFIRTADFDLPDKATGLWSLLATQP
jgi:hypothetical protein